MDETEIITNAYNMVIDYLTEHYEGDTPSYVFTEIAKLLLTEGK